MRLADLVRRLSRQQEIAERLRIDPSVQRWMSLAPEARPCLAAACYLAQPRRTLVVTPTYERALQWQARLGLAGVPAARIRILPSGLSVLFEDAAPETIALSDRIGALRQLALEEPGIVIATPQAALERTLPADMLHDAFLEIGEGGEIDIDEIRGKLQRLGYEPAEPVRVPGQFSRRGGILDVFPMGFDRPVRLEFFGDEIESIREFDPMSQRSTRSLGRIEIAPSRETLLPDEHSGITDLIERSLTAEAAHLGETEAARLQELVEGDLQALESRVFFDRLDLYRPWLLPDSRCAVDLLGPDGQLWLDEPLELEAISARSEEELGQALEARSKRGELLHATANDFMLPPEHLAAAERRVGMTLMGGMPSWMSDGEEWEANAGSLEPYRGVATALTQAIRTWIEQEVCVVIATDQPSRAREMLKQIDLFPLDWEEAEGLPTGLHLVEGNLAGGFILADARLAVVTDHELFGVGRLKLPQRKFNEGIPISSVLDLKPGDFVVHINFGIGVYQGLVTRTQEGVEREYLHIEYKHPDKLYVPADQLDRVQKYLSPGDDPPKINRLTGGEWQKTVGKAREEAREFARELIQLYASRKQVQRVSFGTDSPWQAEMEHTFPWAETPSQLQAISEVKQDLEANYPMDRLVCGDVGFGKTEVAIRACFKVAQAGKQVAVLCPTTILSEQHYRSFSERLAGFPTRIGLLNRFCTAKERQEVLEGLEAGEVDIVIGTHALLAKELRFHDLGLLVIDEEQKFGVKHKEALKSLRLNVDVLSMSATPIPRTLSMALMNIREMSVINDPPPGRLPIRTFVKPFGNEVVLEATLRELARGGQVYYVTNQVQGIEHLAEKLRRLIPSAKVAVGHGQMNEKELEPVMVGFIKGEIDILVSTIIVENGLDIANANTLIVENADRFGLSQLYQLRGRVGRSDRQAYAYFLFGDKTLTEGATHRLQALSEFSQLGAGYSLAIRDLQIRGAGDLLGAKQSGQMNAVGYDLYSQLIEAEVQFLKVYADGERPKEIADPLAGLEPLPVIDVPVAAFIPEHYVEHQGQRLYYYKRLMGCRSLTELREVSLEISDRYGVQPVEVAAAVSIISLRIRALSLQMRQIDGRQGRLSIQFMGSFEMPPRLITLLQAKRREVYLSQERLVWPFIGDPIHACDDCLTLIEESLALMEEHRAALRS